MSSLQMYVFFPKPAFGGGLRAVARRKCSHSSSNEMGRDRNNRGKAQSGLHTTNLVFMDSGTLCEAGREAIFG